MMNARFALLVSFALALPGCGSSDDGKASGTSTQRPFAQRPEEGFKQLKAMGVKTVIDFRSYHSTKKLVEAAGMRAIEIPIKADLGSTPPDEVALKKFFEVVLDPANQPVYIHCAFGKDRTGTMAAVYRLEVDHWTPEEALQEMEAFGYHNIYRDLINFVRAYKPRGYV